MSNRTMARWATPLAILVATSLSLTACGSTTDAGQPPEHTSAASNSDSTPAQGTSGCTTESSSVTANGADETTTLDVAGTKRSFTIHVPPKYSGDTPTPLVLNFHGMGSNSGQQMMLTGLANTADQNNFIAVAPNAVGGNWKLPNNDGEEFGETAFLEALTKYLNQNYCVDSQRVYAMGMSMGSAMTFALACAPKSRIAAFGGVGATFYRPVCSKSAPAPIIYFHGTKDKIVPIKGGETPERPVGPTLEAMVDWARHNKCQSKPAEATDSDVTTFTWSNCAGNANVIYHRIKDGGHTWPGTDPAIAGFMELSLGRTTQSISATEAMWEFFEQHTLAQRTD